MPTDIANDPPTGAFDLEDYWKRIAAQRLGLAPTQMLWLWVPTWGLGIMQSVAIAAGTAIAGTKAWRLASVAATPNTGRQLQINTLGLLQAIIPTAATAKYWIGARFGTPVAPAAGSATGIIAKQNVTADGSRELLCGIDKAVSATNYVVSGAAGASLNLGVAIETTLRHDFQVWRDGVNTFGQVDNNAMVSGTARPSADSQPYFQLFEGGATQTFADLEWYAVATEAI